MVCIKFFDVQLKLNHYKTPQLIRIFPNNLYHTIYEIVYIKFNVKTEN